MQKQINRVRWEKGCYVLSLLLILSLSIVFPLSVFAAGETPEKAIKERMKEDTTPGKKIGKDIKKEETDDGDSDPSARPGSEKAKKEKEKKKKKKYSVSASYGVSTDLNKEEPRDYSHSVGLTGGYLLNPKTQFSAGVSAGYFSVGRDIPVERNFEANEVSLSASRKFLSRKWRGGTHGVSGSLSCSMFLDEASSYEGYRGILVAGMKQSSVFYGKFAISNSLSGGFLANHYDYSPSSGKSNPDGHLSYGVSGSYIPLKGLSLSAGFGTKVSHRIDGLMTVSFANKLGVSYSFMNLSVSLGFVNGSYAEAPSVDLWYIDQYRQIVSLSIAYEFGW